MGEWKLKRGEQEWPIRDVAMLREWASGKRIVANDYVLNPTLNRWMLASEVPELAGLFAPPQSAGRPAARGSCGLAIACFLFAVMLGMFGMGQGIAYLLTGAAFVFLLVAGIMYVLNK